MADALYLVKNGVPFDIAFTLSPVERLAFIIILGEAEGRIFNRHTFCWEEEENE